MIILGNFDTTSENSLIIKYINTLPKYFNEQYLLPDGSVNKST
jgi:hypothetical protein